MSSANILIVDDEPQIRRVLRSTLSFRGYVITEASSGEEAIDTARKAKPDLILLDVNLPGISGIETCREIRSWSDTPIIILTVRNAERDKVVALDAGGNVAISPSGQRVAILNRGAIQVFQLPAPPPLLMHTSGTSDPTPPAHNAQ